MCTCFPSNTCLSDGRSVSVTTDVNAHGDMIIRIIFIRIHHKIFAYRLLGLTLLCFFLVLFGVVIVDKAGLLICEREIDVIRDPSMSPFLGKDNCYPCAQYDSLYNRLPEEAPTIKSVFPMKTTCAVVTYSKCLYEHSYGRFIDSHDVVLRFNLHPYENATAHGTKTTHMMVNDAFWFEQSSIYGRLEDLRDLPHMLIFNHFAADYKCGFSDKVRYFIEQILKVRNDTLILNPLFIQSALASTGVSLRNYRGKLSSGFQGMYLMSKCCDVINAFGFCPDIQGDYNRIVHNFQREHARYWEWIKRRNGSFILNAFPPYL